MRFKIRFKNETVGFSELEAGDAPMGVASGRFIPTSAYSLIRPHCLEHRDDWAPIPGLTVETDGGVSIQCSGGIQIIDFSAELGEAGIQIDLYGVTNPPYAELFPHHMETCKNQFRR
jgi:hypothetical protein